jgi:hypothetical protein
MGNGDQPTTELVQAFRSHAIRLAEHPGFVHRSWYVEYHLEIVEQIALELADIYPEADKNFVLVLVWLHDYGKFIDREREHELTLTEGRRALIDIGFTPDFTDKAVKYIRMLDNSRKIDLRKAPIEVRIVSSADGSAHFVGPFFQIWLWEHPERPLRQLLEENRRKAEKDWTRKIVLPEARAAIESRYRTVREQNGILSRSYISDVAH